MNLSAVHKYWVSDVQETKNNKPEDYLMFPERSGYLLSVFNKYVPKRHNILEIGCNSGRNLASLYGFGYKHLHGIDINSSAIELAKIKFPYLDLQCVSIEEYITDMPNYDTIFTMATFEHIHPDSEYIFKPISEKARQIITIEDEKTISQRHFPRNYKRIFESLGKKEIHRESVPILSKSFRLRILK